MKILDHRQNLAQFLTGLHDSEVTIATAFASKTEGVIDALLANGNQVTLFVGTINHFTDPVFIRYCAKRAKDSSLTLFVDFRGNDSIHWKLYLAAPDRVVIGSPNLTTTGLAMTRDTAVSLEDINLFQKYLDRVGELQQQPQVVAAIDETRFDQHLADYEKKHRRRYWPPESRSTSDFLAWLAQDDTQFLPIFIWDEDISKAERKEFEQKVKPKLKEKPQGAPSVKLPELILEGWHEGTKAEQVYTDGETVLEMKNNGTHIIFRTFDRVIYHRKKWWLCRFKGKRTQAPFKLTSELKRAIKAKAEDWYDSEKSYLDSQDLRELADQLQALR